MKGGFNIMRKHVGAVIAVLVAGAAFGQTESAVKFEAADIHPSPAAAPGNNPNQFMRGGFYRGGRYEVRTATMVDLVRTAYNVDADKVTGGPAWMDKDQFDIVAKAPADSTADALQAMLRNLLAERFSLAVHNDTKPLPAYAITQGKKVLLKPAGGSDETGCKMVPPPEPPAGGPMMGIFMNGVAIRMSPGSLMTYSCHNMTMAALPDQLRSMIFVPGYLNGNRVVDETELKGAWDFDIKFSANFRMPAQAAEGAPEVVTIFTAFEKQLGLKLELTKIPMPVIAVDSVNEKPTENLPGVSAKMPAPPTEFEVADIKPSDPNPPQGPFGGGCFFCPGGRVNLTRNTMADLISLAWNMNGPGSNGRITGIPKSMEKVNWDIIAKASTMSPLNAPVPINGQVAQPQVDFDSMRIMLQALLKDRFKLAIHEETRPLAGYALVAVKPKLKAADPSNRPGCKEGPGPDGKDPRTLNPAAGRLVTCLNMSVADFAAQIPVRANGYFMDLPGGVVDATKLEGNYDITLNFSVAGMVGGGGRGGGGGAPGEASDPGGGITLQEAIEKQLGLKLEPQKNPGMVLVVDHVEEKPSEN
jgi:uncharacterized protein (TIGR03435 family)